MAQAPPTLRLRGGDGEVFEVDARRLAALFPAFVLRVPAIDNFGVFKLISAYRKFEASGRHTDPDVENAFVKTIGDLDNLARVVSAAMQLELRSCPAEPVPASDNCEYRAGKGCGKSPEFAGTGGELVIFWVHAMNFFLIASYICTFRP
ncbi:uncharacterized protein LOC124648372 [Lolium rigidum]|uniref:uncharacterized protein LOC124648372 n=1 Tax=Lolium rigidum TaxID=89674 RepID=UPI001F5DAEDC|nr:uncharacterized protein LOC124648372 [Lolium rigidum]